MKFAFIINFSLFSWEMCFDFSSEIVTSWNKGHKHPEHLLQCVVLMNECDSLTLEQVKAAVYKGLAGELTSALPFALSILPQ